MKYYGGQCQAYWVKITSRAPAFLIKACLNEAMVVWTMTMKGREEMHGSREEMFQEERKNKEKKRQGKQRKEQKRKENNAELRRRSKAMAIAYYYEEAEHYYEEHEYDEERRTIRPLLPVEDYIEERNSDIRKRLYQRNQPARTSRHIRWEKEMQLRRKQKEEQATEAQIIIYETEQQQEQKNKDDKKRKGTARHNHIIGWIREWLTLLTQLDGTGHDRLSKMA
jgi:hypothetical protein